MEISQNELEISQLANKLKLPAFANYKKNIKANTSFEENLLNILRLENDLRQRDLMKRKIKQAGFPIQKTIDTFQFSEERLPYLKQEQILEIMQCDFIQDHTNVVAIGNSGTGKSHIMTAIGMEAIRKGYSVKFRRACDLVTQLSEAKSDKHLSVMLKSLNKCQLLLLDEMGYITMDQKSSNLLFQVLAARYEVRSTIVTSNLEFSKWPDFIGDPIMATALVDRLVHRSTVLNMNGEGYRLRDGRKSLSKSTLG